MTFGEFAPNFFFYVYFCCLFLTDIRPQDAWSEQFRLNWIAKEPHAEASLTLGESRECYCVNDRFMLHEEWRGALQREWLGRADCRLVLLFGPFTFDWSYCQCCLTRFTHFRCKPRLFTLSLAPEVFAIYHIPYRGRAVSYKDQCL